MTPDDQRLLANLASSPVVQLQKALTRLGMWADIFGQSLLDNDVLAAADAGIEIHEALLEATVAWIATADSAPSLASYIGAHPSAAPVE